MIRRLAVILIGLVLLGVLGTGVYVSVRWAYGAYDDYYYVTADFPRAGQQVQLGTDVRVRGVNIGKVSDIALVDRQAQLTFQIESEYQVSSEAEAVITLKTFLGSKFIDLQFDPSAEAPPLEDGDAIALTHVGPELEDALDDGTRVLDAIDAEDLATVISELAKASRGHGDDISRGLQANAELSGVFADTREDQITAFEDFDKLFAALEPKAGDLNALSDAMNEGAPVYASAEAQGALDRALTNLVPFAENLADIIILERPALDSMYDAGDRVLSAVAANAGGLEQVVHGLYRYVFKLGGAIESNLLADGSAAAGFTNFIGGNTQEEDITQVCTALPPEVREQLPLCEGNR